MRMPDDRIRTAVPKSQWPSREWVQASCLDEYHLARLEVTLASLGRGIVTEQSGL